MIGFADSSGNHPALRLLKLVESTFEQGGWLQQQLQMEFRPQQTEMAVRVAQAMGSDSSLLFEAGTGVGKSLAYLIPGIAYAVHNQRQLVVSSHTISLQEQILEKDLETCRTLFRKTPELSHLANFKASLLIGKSHYLCPGRLSRAIRDQESLLLPQDSAELARIAAWAEHTRTGLVQELQPQPKPEVWDWVNADSSQCNRRNCNHETCHYQKARKQMEEADVLIVNHALLFALLAAGMSPSGDTRGVLRADDFLVLDEAHTVPDIATDHFGLSLSNVGLMRLLHQLFNSKSGKGLLKKYPNEAHFAAVFEAENACVEFFNHIRYQLLHKRPVVRLQKPLWTEDLLSGPLQHIAEMLGGIAQKETDEQAEKEIMDYRRRVLSYKESIGSAIALSEPDQVYWIETTGKKRNNTSLRSAPIDVAPYLRDNLLRRGVSCTFTSATLQDAEGMERFASRCGASGTDHHAVTSPFDYARQMRINIASDCPPLNPEHRTMEQKFLVDTIAFCTSRVKGGTLALFTSYKEMNLVANTIAPDIQKQGRRLYVQGEGLSRSQLVNAMKKEGNAVLFGTDSFWTGVDIPGPALSQVIIVRLPFENPSDPVIAARSEACIERGEHPFAAITLPAAQIKFRQGIGRLIRNQSDQGVLTLLDSRVLRKSYGKAFLAMLPHQNYATFTQFNRLTNFRMFS